MDRAKFDNLTIKGEDLRKNWMGVLIRVMRNQTGNTFKKLDLWTLEEGVAFLCSFEPENFVNSDVIMGFDKVKPADISQIVHSDFVDCIDTEYSIRYLDVETTPNTLFKIEVVKELSLRNKNSIT